MAEEAESQVAWQRISDELREYFEEQRRSWGPVGDALLAKYVAASCTEDERRSVETAMRQFPAVAELVEVARTVLAEVFPPPAVAAPRAQSAWQIVGVGTQLVERLSAWIDQAGNVAAYGLASLLAPPVPALVRAMAPEEGAGAPASWQIPLPGRQATLEVRVEPRPASGDWQVALKLTGTVAPEETPRLEIRNEAGGLEHAGKLSEAPIRLAGGAWTLLITLGSGVFSVPLELGRPPASRTDEA